MTGILEDTRTVDTRPISEIALWAVATDKLMSGCGSAPRKSYVAYPVDKLSADGREQPLLWWMETRSDFQRVRLNCKLPRLHDGDHLAVYDVPDHIIGRVAGYSNPTTFTMKAKE